MVEVAATLHHERRWQDDARAALQRRAEAALLEFLHRGGIAAGFGARALVYGVATMEPALGALYLGRRARRNGAAADRKFHDPHLHGSFRGTRRVRQRNSRGRLAGVCEALPSRLDR